VVSTKREGKSYTKVRCFYFRACSPLSIRVCKSAAIEWEKKINGKFRLRHSR
jgi:hypothetical protein